MREKTRSESKDANQNLLENVTALLGCFLLLVDDGLLLADLNAVVGLVPLTVRGGVDLNDRVLHQRLGAHQLVVRGVVDNVNDTRLAGAG